MQFVVHMDARPKDLLMYVFSRITELWPQAVAFDVEDPNGITRFDKPQGSLSISGCSLHIYRNSDAHLTEELLGQQVPLLQIEVSGDTVSVTASGASGDVIDHLSRLPIWSYKVDSSRLQAV